MTSEDLPSAWKNAFLGALTRHQNAAALREAMTLGRLRDWTAEMTRVAVAACSGLGWEVAAKGYRAPSLPILRGEYLNLDVTAFAPSTDRWRFPVAIMELENQGDETYIAYNLWKLLCVRADLRALFCYRRDAEDGPALIRTLAGDVVDTLLTRQRVTPHGETIVVIGSRAETDAFPYGYFKWWRLVKSTSRFVLF